MPGEQIDRPNPPPLPSRIADDALDLAAQVERRSLNEDDKASLRGFQRAACYIAAGMLHSELEYSRLSVLLTGRRGRSHDIPQGQRPAQVRPPARSRQTPATRYANSLMVPLP